MALSPDTLKPGTWARARPPVQAAPTVAGTALRLAVGLAVAGLFWSLGWRTLSLVVASLAVLVGGPGLLSARARTLANDAFLRLGGWIGLALRYVLLTPLFVFGFTAARVWLRLAGRDPLQLRDDGRESFWLPSDSDARKTRHATKLFATEATPPRLRPRAVVAAMLLLVCASEGVLRVAGYGDPVLYVDDDVVGYMPAPSQDVRRGGNAVYINAFGMRAPDYAREKPAGVFRVLMLGDSTLYGGSYIDQEETYARLLERGLKAQMPERAVEVLSMGVNGWGPHHELGYVRRFGNFGADLVVVCLPYGDVWRPLSRLSDKPYLPASRPPALALEEVAYHLTWRYRARALGRPSQALRDSRSADGVRAYAELARLLRARGSEVRVEVLPSRGALDAVPEREQLWVDRLKSALRAEGVEVGYALEAMRRGDASLYEDGVHLSVAGHAHYASYLGERLRPALAALRGGTR